MKDNKAFIYFQLYFSATSDIMVAGNIKICNTKMLFSNSEMPAIGSVPLTVAPSVTWALLWEMRTLRNREQLLERPASPQPTQLHTTHHLWTTTIHRNTTLCSTRSISQCWGVPSPQMMYLLRTQATRLLWWPQLILMSTTLWWVVDPRMREMLCCALTNSPALLPAG